MLGIGYRFCWMVLLSMHSPARSATITAESSDWGLFVLSSREFSELIESVPVVGRRVLAALAERLREAERAQPQH